MNSIKTRVGVIATALIATSLSAPNATAAAHPTTTTPVPYLCRTTENGGWIPINGHVRNYDSVAPASVKAGQVFLASVDPAPSSTNSAYMKTIKDVTVAFKLPTGTDLVGYVISNGSGLGAGALKVKIVGEQFNVIAPGPIAGGTVYDMPKVTFILRAPQAGTVITRPGGTSFVEPGFAFTRMLVGEEEWGPLQCYPDPAQPVQFTATVVS